MIKNIKRVGIIFLAVAIVCLMAIGCLVSTNVIVVGGTKKDSLTNLENKEVVADSEFDENDYDFKLSGTCEAMATEWDKAVKQSKANGGTQVKVLMKGNWTAKDTTMVLDGKETETTAFGDDINAFKDGAIYIAEGVNILLDLNGYVVNRNIKKATYNGMVFWVNGGTLTIEDNTYDEEAVLKNYDLHKDLGIENLQYFIVNTIKGGITGGAGRNQSGGIYACAGSTINFNSGKLYGNIYAQNGGGIFAEAKCVVNINGGIIFGNKANVKGGGIYVVESTLNLNNGIILGNKSEADGGGVYALESKVNVEDIIVGTNSIYSGAGGGMCLISCDTIINNGLFYGNSNDYDGGGIYVSGTKEAIGKCTINNATVKNNFSQHGAGVYFRNDVEAVINNCEIGGNKSTNVGTGLLLYADVKCTINNINIHDNVAMHDSSFGVIGAGIIVATNSELTFNGGKVVNNRIIARTDELRHGYGVGIGIFDNNSESTSIINLNAGIVSGNRGWDDGVGLYNISPRAIVNIAKTFKIFDNYKVDENDEIIGASDVYVKQGEKINITGALEGVGEPHIGISLADDYGNEPFTSGYSTYNTDSPYMHFFNNKVSSIAALNNGDVVFENIISSNVYDFIYLENGKRKNYSDNNLIHAVNDYVKRQEVNGGKLVWGNITPNTSVNQFISNINYDGTSIKLLNGAKEVVYGEGADSKFADKLNNGNEFAVGTGWKVEIYTNSGEMVEEIYLSVLGDLTGDGKVNSADVNYIRQLANDKKSFNGLSDKAYIQLATLIVNKNGLANIDCEILWNVACGKIDIADFI